MTATAFAEAPSPFDLRGRIALITGAARGQGAEEARLLAAHGATVAIADIRDGEGEELAASIPGSTYVRLDVGSEAAWHLVVEQLVSRHGAIDILINNAAISHFAALQDTSLEAFEHVMRINLTSSFLGMRAVVPTMKAKRRGAIVNISSIAGLTGRGNLASYAASKWAVRGLSKSAAVELGNHGIRVNTIIPGLIETPMTREAYGPDRLRDRGSALPVGRAGQSSDIARMALYLVSDASGFCTGAEFVCDGGETAGVA